MTEKVTDDPNKGNSSTGEPKPKAQDAPNPDKAGDLNQVKTELAEVKQTLTRYQEQVKGSSEEALRLKGELEKATARLVELEATPREVDASLQKSWEDNPLQAVKETVQTEVAVLKKQVDALLDLRSQDVFSKFKSQHPGLDGDVLASFNKKLEQLKPTYSDVNVAMRDAYSLVGGAEADVKAVEAAKVAKESEGAEKQSQEQKEAALKEVSEGSQKDRQPLTDQTSELQKKLDDLNAQIYRESVLGQTKVEKMVAKKKLEFEIKRLEAKTD